MKKYTLVIIIFLAVFIFHTFIKGNNLNKEGTILKDIEVSDTVWINCDSVFESSHQIALIGISDNSQDVHNTVFQILRRTNDSWDTVFTDSIFSSTRTVEFEDYNNDGTVDILIQNTSSARSNWTYYLYLINKDGITKVRNFETILSPSYNSEDQIITSDIISGVNSTKFYQLRGDSIYDFEIEIKDIRPESDPDNIDFYDSEYKKAMKVIKSKKAPQN